MDEILERNSVSKDSGKPPYSKKPIEFFLNALGNPQEKLRIIHVTGTKGKGSICYYTCRLLREIGLDVGLYLSPHVESFLERIQVNEIPISIDIFFENLCLIQKIQKIQKIPLSIFEIFTIIALQYFYQKKVNFVLMETGVGGRLDGTNCIKNPIACLFSEIGMDHTNILGNSIKKITIEKSGIIKKNTVVFSVNQKPTVSNIIQKICSLQSCKFFSYSKHAFTKLKFDIYDLYKKFIPEYKKKNLFFSKFFLKILFPNFSNKINSSFINLHIPGRFEFIGENIILDVAHNTLSIKALIRDVSTLPLNFLKKIRVIFYCLKDKNEEKLFSFFPKQWYIYFYKLKNSSLPYEDLERTIEKIRNPSKYIRILERFSEFENIFLQNQKDLFLVTGSFHIVSLFRRKIKESISIQNAIYPNNNQKLN